MIKSIYSLIAKNLKYVVKLYKIQIIIGSYEKNKVILRIA